MTEHTSSSKHGDRLIPFDSEAFEKGIGKRGYPELHKRAHKDGSRSTIEEAARGEDDPKEPGEH